MGGNAMSFETVRVDRRSYEIIKNIVVKDVRLALANLTNERTALGLNFLNSEFPMVHEIVAYSEKESFGDLDILIYDAGLIQDRMAFIKNMFDPKEIYHNSNCYSFDYSGFPLRVSDESFQVDFIFVSPGEFQSSMQYFAFNDLGNLMGRIYHKFGLKYGHDGLKMVIRDDDHTIGEILLTKDISEICQLGGYDYYIFQQGFKNLEEVFKYVISSPYYSYSIFDLDNRNYKARIRDAKRKTYTEFLKWAKERDTQFDFKWNPDKKVYLDRIFAFFPHAKYEYDAIMSNNEIRKIIKEKFNGKIVMDATGLEGKELGAFMTSYKGAYEQYLLGMERHVIIDLIKSHYENWKKNNG